MILPRLTPDEAVTTAVLLDPHEVPVGDPRLRDLDEWLCRCTVGTTGEAWFVAWGDSSLGFAVLWPEDRIADLLIEAYARARETLERLVLEHFDTETLAPN